MRAWSTTAWAPESGGSRCHPFRPARARVAVTNVWDFVQIFTDLSAWSAILFQVYMPVCTQSKWDWAVGNYCHVLFWFLTFWNADKFYSTVATGIINENNRRVLFEDQFANIFNTDLLKCSISALVGCLARKNAYVWTEFKASSKRYSSFFMFKIAFAFAKLCDNGLQPDSKSGNVSFLLMMTERPSVHPDYSV